MLINDIVAKELPEFLSILTDLHKQGDDIASYVTALHQKIESNREDGISFLEMKCHLFLEYQINLTYLMILKIDGQSFVDQPCIDRLVEVRTVLEKIRPIDKKLNYQIDKLVKMASEELGEYEHHPLSFKPNLENLVSKEDENENASETEEKSGVYVPPKVTAVPYEEENKLTQKEKKSEKARQRSLNSALLQDLREEYGDAPEEIKNIQTNSKRAKIKEKEDERRRYEEDNLTRLSLTKKDKMMKRKLNDLDEIVKIGSFKDDESSDEDDYKPKKKKGKGKRKFGGQTKKFQKRMQKRRK
ncbi:neuroguidin-like [Hydractinia symbiolongicarpus]|uniref:neuroguidin-like n=1 Tax=Hydractinia symbiolongicarpus TaxID=13093 RepID=UPI00254C3E81|nr:neuroguidin-like [Hydractinia symbiolongicarpus]